MLPARASRRPRFGVRGGVVREKCANACVKMYIWEHACICMRACMHCMCVTDQPMLCESCCVSEDTSSTCTVLRRNFFQVQVFQNGSAEVCSAQMPAGGILAELISGCGAHATPDRVHGPKQSYTSRCMAHQTTVIEAHPKTLAVTLP